MAMVKHLICSLSLLGAVAVLIFGCARDTSSNSADPPAAATDTHASNGKMLEGLALLTQAERTQAEEQRICPVSNEPLGSMGKPPKVTIDGRDVYLCCAGCEQELRENPDKYLAKLKTE